MRRLAFALAILGALLAGWLPALAASAGAAQAVVHAGDHAGHHGDHGKPAQHPVACPVCFAIVAQALETPRRQAVASARFSFAVAALDGLTLSPRAPPPRA